MVKLISINTKGGDIMARIACEVSNCSHNKENVCYANVINVGGLNAEKDSDTCCGSFLDSVHYGTLTNNVNDPGKPCSAITCNVISCTYNSNKVCSADSIQVSGENADIYTETDCLTFKNKNN